MASWGDVNLGLNRLVAEGLISRFGTNLGDPNRSGPITVMVVAAGAGEEADVRGAVARVLARLGLVAEITVEPGLARRTGATE